MRCNHIKSVTEGSRSRNAIGCMSRRLWWEGLGAGSVGGELWHCAPLGSCGLYSSLFLISLFIISTITIINFISVTKRFLPRPEGVSKRCVVLRCQLGWTMTQQCPSKPSTTLQWHLYLQNSVKGSLKNLTWHTQIWKTQLSRLTSFSIYFTQLISCTWIWITWMCDIFHNVT